MVSCTNIIYRHSKSWQQKYLIKANVVLQLPCSYHVPLSDSHELHFQRYRPVRGIEVEEPHIWIYAQKSSHIRVIWQCSWKAYYADHALTRLYLHKNTFVILTVTCSLLWKEVGWQMFYSAQQKVQKLLVITRLSKRKLSSVDALKSRKVD